MPVIKKSAGAEVETVIRHIQTLVSCGRLLPGDRLPAERKLSEDLGVSRAQVRLALERLAFYGVVRTFPQSGSVLSDHAPSVIVGQISNMLEVESFDFYSLVHVRYILETEAIRLCAANRTDEDLKAIRHAHQDFIQCAGSELRDEKDFAFHTAIAKASHNPVIASLLLVVTPQVLEYYRRLKACTIGPDMVISEHQKMLEYIEKKDPESAAACLRDHLTAIREFAAKHSGTLPRTRL